MVETLAESAARIQKGELRFKWIVEEAIRRCGDDPQEKEYVYTTMYDASITNVNDFCFTTD